MYNDEMSNEQIVEQFQQILATLKRIVEASGDLAARVDGLERSSGDTLGALTSIQGNVQLLLDTYQAQGIKQNRINEQVARSIADLEAKLAELGGGATPVM